MARWRLTAAHYLSVPGTEWEYKELDQVTGRQVRKIFPVPLYLNPDDKEWGGKDIVVCQGGGERGDIEFTGEPTADMFPLDDEATAITDKHKHKWRHPIDSEFTVGGGYTQSLISTLEKQMAELLAGQQTKAAPPVSTAGIDPAAFAKVQEQLATLMAQNEELKEKLATIRRA